MKNLAMQANLQLTFPFSLTNIEIGIFPMSVRIFIWSDIGHSIVHQFNVTKDKIKTFHGCTVTQ